MRFFLLSVDPKKRGLEIDVIKGHMDEISMTVRRPGLSFGGRSFIIGPYMDTCLIAFEDEWHGAAFEGRLMGLARTWAQADWLPESDRDFGALMSDEQRWKDLMNRLLNLYNA